MSMGGITSSGGDASRKAKGIWMALKETRTITGEAGIQAAVKLLEAGELAAFPTETV
jgi:hypothetical protein